MPGRGFVIAVASWALGIGSAAAIGAAPPPPWYALTPIIRSGDPAPGTGATFTDFDGVVPAAVGLVAFRADLAAPAGSNRAIYAGAGLVARTGDAAPGVAGATFIEFEPFTSRRSVTDRGAVAFIGSMDGVPFAEVQGLFLGAPGAVGLVAQRGMVAPGTGGRRYDVFRHVAVGAGGALVVAGELDGNPVSSAFVSIDGEIVLREGDAIPGDGGMSWTNAFGPIAASPSGAVIIAGNPAHDLASPPSVALLRRPGSGGLVEQVIAATGMLVTIEGVPMPIVGVRELALDAQGTWAIGLRVSTSGPPETWKVILHEDGTAVQGGRPVPELPGVFIDAPTVIGIEGGGALIWVARLTGAVRSGADEAIFRGDHLIWRSGEPVPGLPPGTVFDGFNPGLATVNDDGTIFFEAGYSGSVEGEGLFALVPLDVPCPADLDDDGSVGFSDLLLVLGFWGPCAPPCPSDLDGSGDVEFNDLLAVLGAWGTCP